MKEIIEQTLQEDIGTGDVTTESLIPPSIPANGRFLAKSAGILAGLPVAEFAFMTLDSSLEFQTYFQDGDKIKPGDVIAQVSGAARSLLCGERVSLNFLQRLSGIATLTGKFVEASRLYRVRIVDTRKTTPGLRMLEKYAVRQGGGSNHRFGLYDAVLIKDNHLAALKGNIKEAVRLARENSPHTITVEVETTDEEQVKEALAAGADIIMLDNMPVAEMKRMVELINRKALVEASGNVTLENVAEIAACGVDIISVGALTHSAPALDISLEMEVG